MKMACEDRFSVGKLGGFLSAIVAALLFLYPVLQITFFGDWNVIYANIVGGDLIVLAEIFGAIIAGAIFGAVGFGYLGTNSKGWGAVFGAITGLALLGVYWMWQQMQGIITITEDFSLTTTWVYTLFEIIGIVAYACGIYVAGQSAKQ